MAYFLLDFFKKIIRIFKWIPIIWKIYDFDYQYSLDVFKFQLSNLAKFLESNKAYSVDAKLYAQKIKTALKLMEKVYNDEYSMEYIKTCESLYGKKKFVFNPSKYKDLDIMEIKYEKYYNEEELKTIKNHEKQLRQESEAKQEKAERILWKFIQQNIRHWWD